MYMDKEDNTSSKASGAKNINFAYFEELYLIFGKDPNVAPVAIAGSNVVDPKVSDAVEASKDISCKSCRHYFFNISIIHYEYSSGISNDGKKIKASKDTPAPKRNKYVHMVNYSKKLLK
ncbi:hypothetical protein QE152_g30816 [Popillia japonica]|uniref:Uncharacterized protein n=1 Tax=Popillia japonica TaxID=7064 RepID=A0AAW1JDU0_POPJA